MTDIDRIEERLTAVERTVVDGDYELDELADVASLADQLAAVEDRLAAVEDRLATLEGRSQAIGGYVTNVQSVNDDVEQQASAALATVDRLEDRIAELEARLDDAEGVPSDGRRPASRRDDPSKGGGVDAAGNGPTDGDGRSRGASSDRRDSTTATVDDLFPGDAGRGDSGRNDESTAAADGAGGDGATSTPVDGADTDRRSGRGRGSDDDESIRGSPSADDRAVAQELGDDDRRDDQPAVDAEEDASDDDDGGFFDSLRSSLS